MKASFALLVLTSVLLSACGSDGGGPPPPPSDGEIDDDIQVRWMRDDPAIAANITRTIYQGRVMLTGHAPSQAVADAAVADAWRAAGVREVINEIKVGPAQPSSSSDGWILTKLNTQIALDPDIAGSHFKLQCVDGVVYALGIADSPEERNRVLNDARTIDGVRRVVDNILVRPPALSPAERPPTPAAPAESPSPEEGAPPAPPAEHPGAIEAVPLK